MSLQLFFFSKFCFLGIFGSIDACFFCIVSGYSNQFLLRFLCSLEPLYRWIVAIIIIIIISSSSSSIHSLEFFISALADGSSLESEWQQVSLSLQDSSQYSGRSQQWCRLDGLHLSANFQVLQSL